jgi:ethanolamine utilization protein EutA (predicted chaperonin)
MTQNFAVAGTFPWTMERAQLLDLVARAREAATECEDLIAALRKKLKSLKTDGEEAAVAQSILATLESEYDRVLMEMNRFLNELDKIAPT